MNILELIKKVTLCDGKPFSSIKRAFYTHECIKYYKKNYNSINTQVLLSNVVLALSLYGLNDLELDDIKIEYKINEINHVSVIGNIDINIDGIGRLNVNLYTRDENCSAKLECTELNASFNPTSAINPNIEFQYNGMILKLLLSVIKNIGLNYKAKFNDTI